MVPEMRFLHAIMGGRPYEGLTTLRLAVACLYLLGILSVVQIVGSSLLVSMELAGSVLDVWAALVLIAVWLFLDRKINTKITSGHPLWCTGFTSSS